MESQSTPAIRDHALPTSTVSYNRTFHQEVSNFSIREPGPTRVTETDPSCMSVFRYPFKPPSFTHACYRCNQTAFLGALATMIFTFLAQAVLTLRSVFLGSDCFVLIAVESNRIYAVTRKNRIIASCFGVIAMSQVVLGLYMTAFAAKAGCKSVIKRPLQPLPTLLFQRHRS